ncbi:MAG: ArnT family glycosyltransferase [Planctomycetaceae bacterium]
MPFARSTALVVAVAAALVVLPNLGGPPLWDDDEPRNAACSVAMLGSGDWIVPTFNGRLRVEKPALVNWLHVAGFGVAGINETGARLGSALLTIGTCVLTAAVAAAAMHPQAGLWAGLAMATCLWTGITGRASTPDAPLAFFTTLALWLFVRGCRVAGPDGAGWRCGCPRLPLGSAVAVGAACGLATLTKGPVGMVLPLLAFGGFCWWQAAADPGRVAPLHRRLAASLPTAWRSCRPLAIVGSAAMVALPWYALVTIRTDGEWLRQFLLVHNVGRFAAPMEGHSGSALVYYPVVLLIGTFPWSIAWIPIAGHAFRHARSAPSGETMGLRLAVCWAAAWIVPFCLSGTKLPGYVWPAYPALALAAGSFLADWIGRSAAHRDAWMRVAWASLAITGVALAVGLPLVVRTYASDATWLGFVGAVPVAGAAAAWLAQSAGRRRHAAVAWAATACGTVGLLVALGPACMGRAGGTRQLFADVPMAASGPVPVASFGAPASAVFYAGRIAPAGFVPDLAGPAEAAAFVAENPGGHVVVNARFEETFARALPPHYGVVRSSTSFPTLQEVVLFGPAPGPRVAADEPPPSRH